MIIETKLDFKRYLRLMYTLTYRRLMMIFLTIIGLIMFITSILYFLGLSSMYSETPYYQIVFGSVIIFVIPFSVYRSAKKNFSTYGKLQERILYEFTEDKIKLIGETFNSEMDWSKIYKILELKEWILIYQNRLVANILPKDSFGDNLVEFKDLVRMKNIKAKLK